MKPTPHPSIYRCGDDRWLLPLNVKIVPCTRNVVKDTIDLSPPPRGLLRSLQDSVRALENRRPTLKEATLEAFKS